MSHESFLKERALCLSTPQNGTPTIHYSCVSKETDGFKGQRGVINFCLGNAWFFP